jgi:hypothetical protein
MICSSAPYVTCFALLLFSTRAWVLSLCSFFCPLLSALFNGVCLSGFHHNFLKFLELFDIAKQIVF